MRCLLLNKREAVIYAFDAVDLPDARRQLQTYCMKDQTSYDLATVVRSGVVSTPKAQPVFLDQAVP